MEGSKLAYYASEKHSEHPDKTLKPSTPKRTVVITPATTVETEQAELLFVLVNNLTDSSKEDRLMLRCENKKELHAWVFAVKNNLSVCTSSEMNRTSPSKSSRSELAQAREAAFSRLQVQQLSTQFFLAAAGFAYFLQVEMNNHAFDFTGTAGAGTILCSHWSWFDRCSRRAACGSDHFEHRWHRWIEHLTFGFWCHRRPRSHKKQQTRHNNEK